MQGGEIGVASTKGDGSTFAFYVQTRRSTTPVRNLESDLEKSQANGGIKEPDPDKLSSMDIPSYAVSDLPMHLQSHIHTNKVMANDTRKLNVLVVEDNLVNQKGESSTVACNTC